MGQAKQRGSYQQRVEQAQSKPVEMFTFIAVRHLAGGSTEMFSGKLKLEPNRYSKDVALRNLCGHDVPKWGNDWNHPAAFLSAYIPETKLYKLSKQLRGPDALLLEFWDTDPDNPAAYSCRTCAAFDSGNYAAMVQATMERLNINANTHEIAGPAAIH